MRTAMRARISDLTKSRIENTARKEGRPFQDMLNRMIEESFKLRNGVSMPVPTVTIEARAPGGGASTLSFHSPRSLIVAVKAIAKADGRSLSSEIVALLKTAVRQRGLMPAPDAA